MKKILIALAVIAILTIIIVASIKGSSVKKGKEVYIETAERSDIVSAVSASGEIQPKKQVKISSDVIGKIEVLNVKEGDFVEKGQMLLQLDPDIYQSDVDNLEASVRMAVIDIENRKLNLSRAKKKMERNRDLFEKGLVSRDVLDDFELNYESAKISVQVAEETLLQSRASLRRAKKSLKNTTIISPISGIITFLNAEEGETVMTGTMNNAGTVIMIVSDMNEVIAELEVDESYIVKLELGQNASIDVDAIEDVQYKGTVTEIGSSAKISKENIPVFDIEITLQNPDKRLFPGMSCDGNIETGSHSMVITVPIQAVVRREKDNSGEKESALFVFDNGETKLAFVKTGLSNETHIEIIEGLSEKDKVITGPYRILRDLKDGEAVVEKESKTFNNKKDKDKKKESGKMEVKVN